MSNKSIKSGQHTPSENEIAAMVANTQAFYQLDPDFPYSILKFPFGAFGIGEPVDISKLPDE
jgi:hypothetical protein